MTGWKVEVELDSVWTDISADLWSLDTNRQTARTDGALRRPQSGTATVVLDNTERTYDPDPAGDYRPGINIRISWVTSTPTTYRVFTGRVDDIQVEYSQFARTSQATLYASDGLARLAKSILSEEDPAVGGSDTVAERIDRVLDDISWPGGDRDITAGGAQLVATSYGVSALDEIISAVDAENGGVWIDANNHVAFRPLGTILAASSSATFTDNASGVRFFDPVVIYDDEELTNRILYKRVGDSTVLTLEDTSSQTRYTDGIPAVYERLDLPHLASQAATDWASLTLLALATPEYRVAQITCEPFHDEAEAVTILGLDITDRVTVSLTPPGGGSTIDRDCFIAGINHSGFGTQWYATLTLASASRFNFLRYDDPDAVLNTSGFAPDITPTFTGGRYVAVAGDIVVRSDWNMLAEQMVMVFDSGAARDAALTPSEGMVVYRSDLGTIQYYDGTRWLKPRG